MEVFRAKDKVKVSEDFFWAKGATGTISPFPASGTLTRSEKSALGVNVVYWVWFDIPQLDADGDGPYRAGQIWQMALTRIQEL